MICRFDERPNHAGVLRARVKVDVVVSVCLRLPLLRMVVPATTGCV